MTEGMPTDTWARLRPEVQEIQSLTEAIIDHRNSKAPIGDIKRRLFRLATLLDNELPVDREEEEFFLRAHAAIFTLGYGLSENWATFFVKLTVDAIEKAEADAPEDYDA